MTCGSQRAVDLVHPVGSPGYPAAAETTSTRRPRIVTTRLVASRTAPPRNELAVGPPVSAPPEPEVDNRPDQQRCPYAPDLGDSPVDQRPRSPNSPFDRY